MKTQQTESEIERAESRTVPEILENGKRRDLTKTAGSKDIDAMLDAEHTTAPNKAQHSPFPKFPDNGSLDDVAAYEARAQIAKERDHYKAHADKLAEALRVTTEALYHSDASLAYPHLVANALATLAAYKAAQ